MSSRLKSEIKMPKALIFGAGQNGAGFVGRNLAQNGYGLVFADPSQEALDYVGGSYQVTVVSLSGLETVTINGARGILLSEQNRKDIAQEIAESEAIVTAVGRDYLAGTVSYLKAGLEKFLAGYSGTKNIIFVENHPTATEEVREGLGNLFPDADQRIGLVNSVVHVMGRRDTDGIIVSEKYSEGDFIVDKDAFRGRIPRIAMMPYSPFTHMEDRKLFVHNLGHQVIGLLARENRYKTVHEASKDGIVWGFLRVVTNATCEALHRAYKTGYFTREELMEHRDKIFQRAANIYLGDTTERLVKDPVRKLRYDDRIIGAARLCLSYSVDPAPIAMVAAMTFALPHFRDEIQREGITAVIRKYTGLKANGFENMIVEAYSRLK